MAVIVPVVVHLADVLALRALVDEYLALRDFVEAQDAAGWEWLSDETRLEAMYL